MTPDGQTQPLMLLGRLYEAVPTFLRPVEFRPAQTVEELKAAAHLVYREYLKRHYLVPNASQLKLTIYHALPQTATFIAFHRRAGIIGTIALIEDSPLGLPMDEIYKSELDGLRREGRRVAEVSMLAIDTDLFGRGVFTMFHSKKLLLTLRLFKTMFDYLRSCTKTDELVACFHPKHQVLYEFLQLKPFGDLKTYASANGNPAVARRMNIVETQRQATSHIAYRLFFGKTPSPQAFAKRVRLTADDLRRLFVLDSQILAAVSLSELEHLKHCYPTYNFDTIRNPLASSFR